MRALDAAAQADLDEVVSRDVEAVRAALAGLSPAEPVFATCLHYSPDSAELLDVAVVYVGVEGDRQRVLAVAGGPVEVFTSVWNPMEYTGGELEPEPSLRDDAAFVAVEERLAAALHEAGVDEPGRLVLNEVARRLAESPAVSPVTGDYIAFVMDHYFDERLLENLRAAAPPAVAAQLREQGLLPDTIDELTESTR
jgi:hypothetical protein